MFCNLYYRGMTGAITLERGLYYGQIMGHAISFSATSFNEAQAAFESEVDNLLDN